MEIRRVKRNPLPKFKREWQRYDRIMGHPPYKSRDYYFEIFDGSNLAGYSNIAIEGGVGKLCELLVKGRFRRKGYGGVLVGHFIEFCRAKKCHKVTLSTSEKHPDAVRLYKRLGFRVEGVRRDDTHHFTWYSYYKFLR